MAPLPSSELKCRGDVHAPRCEALRSMKTGVSVNLSGVSYMVGWVLIHNKMWGRSLSFQGSKNPCSGAGSNRPQTRSGGVTREMKIGRIQGYQDNWLRCAPSPRRSLVGFQQFRRRDLRIIRPAPSLAYNRQREIRVGGQLASEAQCPRSQPCVRQMMRGPIHARHTHESIN